MQLTDNHCLVTLRTKDNYKESSDKDKINKKHNYLDNNINTNEDGYSKTEKIKCNKGKFISNYYNRIVSSKEEYLNSLIRNNLFITFLDMNTKSNNDIDIKDNDNDYFSYFNNSDEIINSKLDDSFFSSKKNNNNKDNRNNYKHNYDINDINDNKSDSSILFFHNSLNYSLIKIKEKELCRFDDIENLCFFSEKKIANIVNNKFNQDINKISKDDNKSKIKESEFIFSDYDIILEKSYDHKDIISSYDNKNSINYSNDINSIYSTTSYEDLAFKKYNNTNNEIKNKKYDKCSNNDSDDTLPYTNNDIIVFVKGNDNNVEIQRVSNRFYSTELNDFNKLNNNKKEVNNKNIISLFYNDKAYKEINNIKSDIGNSNNV